MRYTRRELLETISATALTTGFASRSLSGQTAAATGTATPKLKAPANAVDCHHHIYDSRFPADPKAVLRPPDALVEDYRRLQQRIGTTRSVIVQPSTYGTDNRCTLAALAALGSSSRAIAVVTPEVADAELKRLNGLGVKGLRFNLAQAGATTPDMIEPLARRITALGWHVQVNAPPENLVEILPILERLPCPVVFDHLAHIPVDQGPSHPLFARVVKMLDARKAWVKVSAAYIDSKTGGPTYADTSAIARAYVKAAPDRLVWGSDWPHPTAQDNKPDDAVLFDLLLDWAPDERVRHRILVENPAALYGF